MKPSILIVDDHFSICCSLAAILHKKYTIHRAFNGKDALEIFRKNRDIVLILTDINMPIMDGFELIEKVRFYNKDVAIIAMTANCSAENIRKIMAKGADKYLEKPFDIPELELTLQESIGI